MTIRRMILVAVLLPFLAGCPSQPSAAPSMKDAQQQNTNPVTKSDQDDAAPGLK